jgi:hypothetical protein
MTDEIVRSPRLKRDEFHLYDWVHTDGRRLGRQNSDRATRDDAPSADDGREQATLGDD